jgi:predicted nucleic acid-binding protein
MILDTEFLISLQENDDSAIEKAAELDGVPARIPTMVVWELFASVGAGNDPIGNRKKYETLLNAFPLVELDEHIARRAGVLYGTHVASDTLKELDGADSVVAATGLTMDQPVVSNDGDFQDVEGLAVETY